MSRPPPEVLVVPDVRRQAYVFSKGILQDAGFAWRVEGAVEGYAANTVVSQVPAPGVRVVDNGAPTVVLRLKRSGEYEERGVPENHSSYKGTAVVLLSNWQAAQKESAQATTETQPVATTTTLAHHSAAAPPAAPPPAPEQGEESGAFREPDFVVEGAPREPADEMPLPQRARALQERTAALTKPSRAVREPLALPACLAGDRGSLRVAGRGRCTSNPHSGRPQPVRPLRLRRSQRESCAQDPRVRRVQEALN